MSDPIYGNPFLLHVVEGNLNGAIETSDFEGPYKIGHERTFVAAAKDQVQEYGGGITLYACIPIGRVWTDDPGADDDSTNAPDRVVTVDMADTVIERMARAADAMGVSDAKGARP
jgi:hypothetical protein